MILADTSVLMGYFKNKRGIPYDKMDYIINNDMPYGICHYVYQELLQGARNKQEYELLREYLPTLPFYDLRYGKQSFEDAALLFMTCRKKGITLRNTLDFIIAEIAIENNLYLLHDDTDYTNIAKIYKNLKLY